MASENPSKRIKLDVHLNDNLDTPLPESPRIVYRSNRTMKAEIFNMIAEGLDKLRAQFVAKGGNAWAEIGINITVMNRIASILFIIHTKLKSAEYVSRKDTYATCEFKVTYKEASISIPENILTKEWTDLVKERGFAYSTKDQNWIDIADPLIAVMVAFSLRYRELRIGQSRLIKGKHIVTKKEIAVPIRFGLDGSHAALLEGVTYPAAWRNSIARIIGIGPITALILLFKSNDKSFEIWESLVRKTFAHFPRIEDVIKASKQNLISGSIEIINVMSNLALFTKMRASNRAFIPAAAVLKLFKQEEAIESEGSDVIPSILETFDYSGRGLFRFYKEFQKHQWELSGDFTEAEASQIVYHSMFGTFKEDFGVLSQVTNCNSWKTRSEYGSHFRSQETSDKVVRFQPIKQIFYTKLEQTKHFDFGMPNRSWSLQYQCCSAPVFSGRTIRHIDMRIFYGMESDESLTSGELIGLLSSTLKRVLKQVKKDQDIVTRAEVDSITHNADGKEVHNMVFENKDLCFVGDEL